MDVVFVKARKISKSLKGNRGSAVNYSRYLTRELPSVDYSDKGRMLACGIEGTDESILDFWQKAEKRENQTKRKDSARFAKEYIMAIPHNLPIEEQEKVCAEVAKFLSSGNRVVAWYHHEPDKNGDSDERNFHCHFLMSEREYSNHKFSEKKNRDWNSKPFLKKQKKQIGEIINFHLEKMRLPKIKIELTEDEREAREMKADKTENQKKAERAEQKKLKTLEKKLALAEVKLNGLRGNEHGNPNEFGNSETGNSEQVGSLERLNSKFQHERELERDRRLARENAERLADEKRKRDEQFARKQQQELDEIRKRSASKKSRNVRGNEGYGR